MTQWAYFPKSRKAPQLAVAVVDAFGSVAADITSTRFDKPSNQVLAAVAKPLEALGFRVELGKQKDQKIGVPVLFGLNGKPEKTFDADAYHEAAGFVVEVEAGRGVTNNQFLKDLFQACAMHDARELAIAVRITYKKSKDFEYVVRFFDTLFASNRLRLPLEGVLIIGY